MKKASAVLFAFAMTLSLTASAGEFIQAQISKTIPFPVSMLQKVEAAQLEASQRTGDAMEQMYVNEIDSVNHLTVRCAEESPIVYDNHLYGCTLEMTVDLGGGATAVARNMLYITQSSGDVQNVLKQTDSTKSSRVDLKTIFDGGHGSTYYCNSNASAPDGWDCFLNFID